MELWTEYEGILIDDAFPLNKLVSSQGRSAFFSTVIGKDDSRLIRLIACHFDEDEILARWRGVEALGHPNFLKLERYGQLVLDDATVIYAVFERVDMSLADVLSERRLTVEETMQLAASLTTALEMLHIHGFVHEHLSPENVLAVGDVIKLRTDCIRETPEGAKGVEAKQRDVHDLASVLLRALTQSWTIESAGDLPAPFNQIVRNGVMGTWGIGEISAALQGEVQRPRPIAAVTSVAKQPAAAPSAARQTEPALSGAAPSAPRSLSSPLDENAGPALAGDRPPLRIEQVLREAKRHSQWIGAAALAVLVLLIALWFGWRFAHARSTREAGAGDATSAGAVAASAGPSNHVNARSASQKPAAVSVSTPAKSIRPSANRAQWRVVAYTYNRQDQAAKKAASLAEKYPEFRPEVFTPTSRAPFLVTIGGILDKDQAFALVKKAHNAGLPRDTYAQNYNTSR